MTKEAPLSNGSEIGTPLEIRHSLAAPEPDAGVGHSLAAPKSDAGGSFACGPEVKRRRVIRHSLALIATCACLCMLALNVFRREGYSGDEGFYGVTALSLAGPEVLNVLNFAFLLFFSFRLLRLFEEKSAIFGVLLLATSPAIVLYYSQLEAEPLMTTSGIAALYYAMKGDFGPGQRLKLFVSGLCLGLSFALKLWLCGPLALAVMVGLSVRALRSTASLRDKALSALLFGFGALIPAASHLLVIAIVFPGDLGYWLKNIYFGVFTNAGISGSKLAGDGVPSDWIHPVWYYGAALYRDHFFLVPIVLLGFGSVLRDKKLNGPLLWTTLAGAAGVVPLSLLKVKEPLYVLSCSIFLYFLAGMCLAALVRRITSGEELDKFSVRLAPLAILGMLIAVPLAFARGIQPGKITGAFVLAHSIALGIVLAVFLWSQRKRAGAILEWGIYAACVVALFAVFTHDAFTRRPRDKAIATLVQPYLKDNQPGALSVIASNFKCYQFYTFRRGCYWHEIALQQGPDALLGTPQFSQVRAFIVDAEDQQKPEMAPWLRWLEKNADEKTSELNTRLGSLSGFRLFVNRKLG